MEKLDKHQGLFVSLKTPSIIEPDYRICACCSIKLSLYNIYIAIEIYSLTVNDKEVLIMGLEDAESDFKCMKVDSSEGSVVDATSFF